VDGVLNVWVGHVGHDDYRPVTRDTERGIRSYAWAYDNRHLLYVQDRKGDENWRIYAVDLESQDIRDLTPFDGVQARIQKIEKRHPDELVVALNRDDARLHDLYRLNLRSGELTKTAQNPGFIAWVIDHDLRARGAVQPTATGGSNLLVRDSEDTDWRSFLEFPPEDALFSGPVDFALDGRSMWLRSSVGANATRLVRKDLVSGEEVVVAEDPTYDVGGLLIHPDTRNVQAVAYARDRLEWHVVDDAVRPDFAALARLQPGDFRVSDRDNDDRTWVVAFNADDGPVSYYAFDRGSKQAAFLFHHRSDLAEYTLAKMEPFAMNARDGLALHGYLTFPPGARRTRLPAVLNVHGGPWQRDIWGFNPETQWLANRGYLVIQVNFRGSIGYGKKFLNAGDREWGGKMHTDLIDAVNWSIAQGYCDPSRVAIYGGSYGGYAALCGATFSPDVFRCAISICGPASLKTWIETAPPYWGPLIQLLHRRVGDPQADEAFLWSRSPLSRVDQIRIPMLLAHGAHDPRVKLSETMKIVDAMKEKGIEHEVMIFEDEGHGFAKPQNRLRFFAAVEQFLARHLQE
jgi:dipeptidyl aminopeptidase/acylaminoacyl peptidase